MHKLLTFVTLGAVVIALVVGFAAPPTRAADHFDAPLVKADGRLDITDIYAFQHDAHHTVLIMNVNPFAGNSVPANSSRYSFSSTALYQFKIDNTGDFKADIAYRLQFSAPDSAAGEDDTVGHQQVSLRVVTGADAENDAGTGTLIASGRTSGRGVHPINGSQGTELYAGLRDDPFFFDLPAFIKFEGDHNPADFCHPGVDFFAGANVTAMALQIPTSRLVISGQPIIHIWATVSLPNGHGGWTQVERMGKPALATVFIKPTGGANADAYNATKPVNDLARWGSFFPNNAIPLLGGIPVRSLLLPDVLILNTSGPLVLNHIPFQGYPNGRRLQDDVIDTSFAVLANAGVLPSTVTSDCVNHNDGDFETNFPYLRWPHSDNE